MSNRDRWRFLRRGSTDTCWSAPVHRYLITLAALLLLTACTLIDQTDPVTPAANVRDQLAARLAETQQAQVAALALWDRVIFGEIVSCQESFTVPDPVSLSDRSLSEHPNASAIQAQIDAAIQAIRNSADLWHIECADARSYVPLSMAHEGRATALAASESLAEAERLLSEW